MNHETETQKKLKNLYTLLETIKQKRLGVDWESKLSYNKLEKEVVKKIKDIEMAIRSRSMVK